MIWEGNSLSKVNWTTPITQYQKAIEIDPNHKYAHNNLERVWELKDEKTQQEKTQQLVKIILGIAMVVGLLAIFGFLLYREARRKSSQESHGADTILESPDLEYEDSYQEALLLVSQGDPNGALTAIKNCIRLQPSSAEAFNLMGNCYNALNQLDDADYAYDESVKLSSDNYVDPKLGMAEIWVKRDELQRAVDLCQEVIKRTKDTAQTKEQAEAYLKIGLIYMMRNRRPEAMECYRELQKLNQEIADRLFERIHQET